MNKTITKMALKNIFSNKAKTLITLSLIGLGTFLIILGLGILNFAEEQTKNVCISDFTGHILITGKPENDKSFVELVGVSGISVGRGSLKMPYLPQKEKIYSKLKTVDGVLSFTPSAVSQHNTLKPVNLPDSWEADNKKNGFPPFTNCLGIEPESYKKMFDTIQVYEGSFPQQNNEEFFLMPKSTKEAFEKYFERELKIGDEIVITAYGEKTKSKKVRITGFFNYAHPDTDIGRISYCDINSCRILAGMIMGAKVATEIPSSIDLNLSGKSEEDLFGCEENMFDEKADVSGKGLTEADVENILGSTELRDSLNMADTEAWHHIAIKLKNGFFTEQTADELNKWFLNEDIKAQALLWDKGMASYSARINATKKMLTVILVLLSVVVLIVIMNTLVVSVMERTSEIGTMRAIGAKKGFVKKIFYAESFFMSFTGAGAGIILALITAIIFNSLNLRFGSGFALLFGGYNVKVNISILSVLGTAFAMFAAGFAANIYPIKLALKISPLEAINS
ncbi:ABC transporter permease [Treponema pedis]|uniref:ABC transporter permease n=1 Tax=Treponema pedis TaxID=409322 RepID=UPI000429F0C2|nr:FtsX-like permease family protein [Treponema pedis]